VMCLPYVLYYTTSMLRERTFLTFVDVFTLLGWPPNPTAVQLAITFCRNDPLPATDDLSGLETLHVLYASDANGFVGLLSSMLSVSRNLQDPSSAIIHIVVPDTDLASAAVLIECLKRELVDLAALPRVVLHEAKELTFDLATLDSEWIRGSRMGRLKSTWVRLYLDKYLPDVPRVIYLDIDTIVTADLAPLYRMRMQHAVAGVWEPPLQYRACFTQKNLPIAGDVSWAFNAGVLLFDLYAFRSQGILKEMEYWTNVTGGCWGDQLALNLGFQGKVDHLPWAWNVKGIGGRAMMMLQLPCLSNGNVFHWTGGDGSAKQWLPTRRKELDFLFLPYAPREQCAALPAGSLLQQDIGRTEM